MNPRRVLAAVLAGSVISWVVLTGAFGVLRTLWPEYASAEPDKAYTLSMLLVRLLVFSTMIMLTSGIPTVIARDIRLSWLAAGLILARSIPPHLYPGYVWDDYPVWYHLVYLSSIVPLALGAGWMARVWTRQGTPPVRAA
jgi:hypothetical protein